MPKTPFRFQNIFIGRRCSVNTMSDLSIDLIEWKNVNIRNLVLFWIVVFHCVQLLTLTRSCCSDCLTSTVTLEEILVPPIRKFLTRCFGSFVQNHHEAVYRLTTDFKHRATNPNIDRLTVTNRNVVPRKVSTHNVTKTIDTWKCISLVKTNDTQFPMLCKLFKWVGGKGQAGPDLRKQYVPNFHYSAKCLH